MSFLTPVRDPFNRANAPNLGIDWTNLLGGLSIISNQAGAPSTADHLSVYSAASYAADQEMYFTLATPPSTGNTAGGYIRLQNIGSVATLDGYAMILIRLSGAGNDLIQVYRLDNGAGTQLGANIVQEMSAGDKYCLRGQGSTLSVIRENGGVETVLATRTDSTYILPGYTALAANNTTVRFEDFGAGDLSVSASPVPRNMQHYRRRRAA